MGYDKGMEENMEEQKNTADLKGEPELSEFQKESLAACQKIRGTPLSEFKPKAPLALDKALQADLAKAIRSCDVDWARETVAAGADVGAMFDAIDESGGRGRALTMWWSGSESHQHIDARKVEAMARFLDESCVGLGNFNGRVDGGASHADRVRGMLLAGGEQKAKARMEAVSHWPKLANPYGRQPMQFIPGLAALMRRARSWDGELEGAARVPVAESMDAYCEEAGKSPQGLRSLGAFEAGFGVPIGERWALVARGLAVGAGSDKKAQWLGDALRRCSAKNLDEDTATAMMAVACFEGDLDLLEEVCKRAQGIDWSLGAHAKAYASVCFNDSEKQRLGNPHESGKVSALHLARLASGHREVHQYHNAKDRDVFKALMEMSCAKDAAAEYPFTEAFLHCSPSEMIQICRQEPRLARLDAKGRRLLGSPIASWLIAQDASGSTPVDKIRKSSGYKFDEALEKFEKEFSKWERTQMSKEIGRKAKAPAPKAKRL